MSSNEKYPPHHLKVATIISALHVCIGLIFWIWSTTLWARGEYDSGIVLFLFSIATGLVGLRIVHLCHRRQQRNNDNENRRSNNDNIDHDHDQLEEVEAARQKQTSSGRREGNNYCCIFNTCCCCRISTKLYLILLLITHTLTTAAYAFAGAQDPQQFDKTRGWQVYCQIAVVFWAVSGLIVFGLACRYRDKFELL